MQKQVRISSRNHEWHSFQLVRPTGNPHVIHVESENLAFKGGDGHTAGMNMPAAPVTITPEQLKELSDHLSHMRHEINNQLSLIVAALELVRFKPDLQERMLDTVGEQPPKITAEVAKFSTEFERIFKITRESASSAKGFF
jgi:hypothetical protein